MSLKVLGLHHVTSMCSDAVAYDALFAGLPGMGRVKKTVNFDNPSVYHLYYADHDAAPGTVMTYFPTGGLPGGRRGAGEVSVTQFRAGGDPGKLAAELGHLGFRAISSVKVAGHAAVAFSAPDGDRFEAIFDDPTSDYGIQGLWGGVLRVADAGPTTALLRAMGYADIGPDDNRHVMATTAGGIAAHVSVEETQLGHAGGGAGAVHHIAFAVAGLAELEAARASVIDAGFTVTEVRDRKYFRSIYFREPGGVLFEFASLDPGFAVDEPKDTLGRSLCLPDMHEHLRPELEAKLIPLPG